VPGATGLRQPGQCNPVDRGDLTEVCMLPTVPFLAADHNRRATQFPRLAT
jgi:hypothetical protein